MYTLGATLPVDIRFAAKPRAIPAKDGAYLLINKLFYKFTCATTDCSWHKMKQEMSNSTANGVFMQLPKEYSCDG